MSAAAIISVSSTLSYQTAGTKPRFLPAQDVTVTYSSLGDKLPPVARSFSAIQNAARMDLGDMIFLINFTSNQVVMLNEERRIAIYLPRRLANPVLSIWSPPPDANVSRIGIKTIDGYSCTYWHITFRDRDLFDCLTDQGILLMTLNNAGNAKGLGIIATNVSYGPVNGKIFQIPQGYRQVIDNSQ
jgi:hypothetical protein